MFGGEMNNGVQRVWEDEAQNFWRTKGEPQTEFIFGNTDLKMNPWIQKKIPAQTIVSSRAP